MSRLPSSVRPTTRSRFASLLSSTAPSLLLDGDELRVALAADGGGHDPASRRALAHCYARLARLSSRQGLTTIVATVSMFEAVREANRKELARYFEVFVDAPPPMRHANRALYADPGDGRIDGHPAYELPRSPHLALYNDGTVSPRQLAVRIMAAAASQLGSTT